MSSTGATLNQYYLSNYSNQNLVITEISVFDATNASKSSFNNLMLMIGSSFLAGTASPTTVQQPQGYRYDFLLPPNSPLIVPANNIISFTLQGDVPGYVDGAAEDNSVHRFQIIGSSAIKGTKQLSGASITSLGLAFGSPSRVLRSDLGLSITPKSATEGVMEFYNFQLSGVPVLNKITVTFTAARAINPNTSPITISLLDLTGRDVVKAGEAIQAPGGNSNTITWFFPAGWTIESTATFTLTSTAPIEAWVAKTGDILFSDGLDSTAITGIAIPLLPLPIIINPLENPIR